MGAPAHVQEIGSVICRGQRNCARARLNLMARMVTFNGSAACRLIDMSRTGAKIETADCPRLGAMAIIENLPFELFGTVRWIRGTVFGLEFDGEMSHEQVVAMRTYADGETARQKSTELDHVKLWVQGNSQAGR